MIRHLHGQVPVPPPTLSSKSSKKTKANKKEKKDATAMVSLNKMMASDASGYQIFLQFQRELINMRKGVFKTL